MTLTLDISPDLDEARRERLAVALYDAQVVSQDRAALIAGLSRAAFIDLLGKYQVTTFQYDGIDELLAELETLPDQEREAEQREVARRQGSTEWLARLQSTFRSAGHLTDEHTRRESLYGDDLR